MGGVDSLLDAIELGQVTLEELDQPIGAPLNSVGSDVGIIQECLGFGVIQERHEGLRPTCAVSLPQHYYNNLRSIVLRKK